jgi:putative flippase GtrA
MRHETHVSNRQLALQSTLHCLMGCGIGDILGVIIGTIFGLPYVTRIIAGVVFGFIFGFIFSAIPLLKADMPFASAAKIILTTETLSIFVMEAAEAGTELIFPGMRRMGLMHIQYWIGLLTALTAGFVVAFPVNYALVKKGVRHHH